MGPLFMETLNSMLALFSLVCITLFFFFSKNIAKYLKKLVVQVLEHQESDPLKPKFTSIPVFAPLGCMFELSTPLFLTSSNLS